MTKTQVSCCYLNCFCESKIPNLELLLALHVPVFILATKGGLDYNENWPFLANMQPLEGDEQPGCTALLPGLP